MKILDGQKAMTEHKKIDYIKDEYKKGSPKIHQKYVCVKIIKFQTGPNRIWITVL